MQKAYERINWENDLTPLNEDNLNLMDAALNELDNRIISIDTAKLGKTEASSMLTNFALNTETGVITLTYYDGSKQTINTNLAKIALNISYDATNERLVLTMPDGSVTYVDMSVLITLYEFVESDEIYFEVTSDGKVKACIKDGSISEAKLRPNFLAEIKVESSSAATSAKNASTSASNAATSEANAKASEEAAKQAAQTAQEVTNITYASESRAGIVKPKDVYVNQEDGSMEFTARTDTGLLEHSHAGGIRLHSISAVEERQVSTTGAQLFDAGNPTSLNESRCTNADNELKVLTTIAGTSGTTYTFTRWILDIEKLREAGTELTLSVAKIESIGTAKPMLRLVQYDSTNTVLDDSRLSSAGSVTSTILTEAVDARILAYSNFGGTCAVGDGIIYTGLMLNVGTEALPWEPYTGRKPSPAPGEKVVISNNHLKITANEQTTNGLVVSSSADGEIQIAGVSTQSTVIELGTATLEAGTYYITNYVDVLDKSGSYEIWVYDEDDTSTNLAEFTEAEDGEEKSFTLTKTANVVCDITISDGTQLSALFYPMIAKSSGATCDVYEAGYTEGYPQPIEGTLMKNLLDCRGLTEQTTYGVKFTPVYDGEKLLYVEGNGTASDNAWFNFYMNKESLGCLRVGEKYVYSFGGVKNASIHLYVFEFIDGSWVANNSANNVNSIEFSLSKNAKGVYVRVLIAKGYTATNLRLYPMIRPASILDDTYVPYGCMRVVGMRKNLLKNICTSQTVSGLTVTVHDDGSMTIDGTSTGIRDLRIKTQNFPIGNYILSSGVNLPSNTYLTAHRSDDKDIGVSPNKNSAVISDEYQIQHIHLWIGSGVTFNNLTIYPMLRLAEIEDDTWEPYQEPQSTILSKPFAEFHNIGGEGDRLTSKSEVRRFAEVVFDGSESGWSWNGTYNFAYTTAITKYAKQSSNYVPANAKCDYFEVVARESIWNYETACFVNIKGDFGIKSPAFTNVDEAKAFLASNPITVVYELAEEVVTMLPTADQIALHSLKSYDGVTQLFTDTYPPMVIDCEWGTSKVGAEMYEAWNMGKRAEIENAELRSMITNLATALVAGSEV